MLIPLVGHPSHDGPRATAANFGGGRDSAMAVPADGTIAIMSSGGGSVANDEHAGFEIYRASKSALDQLMRSYAARYCDDSRTLLLMAPGWVKTDFGAPNARLTIDESIPRLVSTVHAQRGVTGLQFVDSRANAVV
jgi:NAD(P)-dependent dehydrogenase (short-subunit alcohol dehydrogenase family)